MQDETWLTIVVKTVLEGSKHVTNEELLRWYEDETVIQSWRKNPLGDFMTVLAGALETERKSAERERANEQTAHSFGAAISTDVARVEHPRIAITRYHATCRLKFLFNAVHKNLLPLNIRERRHLRLLHPTAPHPPTVPLKTSTNLNLMYRNSRTYLSVL